MQDIEMRDMLIEYMGRGFLENIIAMLKQDRSLYRFIPDMLAAEDIRVRLGATALVEDLARDHREEIRAAVPGIIRLLGHANPNIRGDAANALGIIGDPESEGPLRGLLNDENEAVRDIIKDALVELGMHSTRGVPAREDV